MLLIVGFGLARGDAVIAGPPSERGNDMARYTHSATPDWESVAHFYGHLVGLLVAKTGPVVISQEDMYLYNLARVKPFIEQNEDIDGVRAFLLGEDEWPERDTNEIASIG